MYGRAYVVMGMVLTLIHLLLNMKYYKFAKMASSQEPPTKSIVYSLASRSYASIVKYTWDTKQFLLSTYIEHLKTQFFETFQTLQWKQTEWQIYFRRSAVVQTDSNKRRSVYHDCWKSVSNHI